MGFSCIYLMLETRMVQRVLRNPKQHPRFISPMECQRVPKLPEGDDWLYEIKQDGYRVIAVVDGNTVLLYSMSGLDYSREFPHVAFALKSLKRKMVLDGEIVALDEQGRANFQELQNRKSTRFPIVYYVFDLLHENGRDLNDLPLSQRKERLEKIGQHFSEPVRLNPVFDTELAPLIEQVKKLGLEGIVAKRSTSIYIPGKESYEWQKHRFNEEDVFYIGGYIPGAQGIGELLIGEFRPPGKQLYFIKRLIAGLNKFNRGQIYDAIQDLKAKTCPFGNLPEKPSEHQHALTKEVMAECIWTKPEQPCEVEFIERTRNRRLRHAEFRRLLPR
jgi:bifunctional non-homologous end joining protein LigD